MLPSFIPSVPDEYRQYEDPARARLAAYLRAAAKNTDADWHHEGIAALFPSMPLEHFLGDCKSETRDQIIRVLQPKVDEQMASYLGNFAIPPSYVPEIPEESKLPFYLLWCGDGLTARHSLNTSFVIRAVSALLEVGSAEVQLPQVGLLHDIGKGDIPRFVLEDPTPRTLMGPLLAMHLSDPNRPSGRRVASPIPLTPEQAAYFEPLLSGADKSPDLVREFGVLCSEQKHIDYRKVLPIRTLLNLAVYIQENGKLPPQLMSYAEQYLNAAAVAEIKHMVKVVKSYKGDLRDLEMILARFGIDGWVDTLLDVLQRHEGRAFNYVPSRLGCVVVSHHDYELTKRTMSTRAGYSREPNDMVRWSLTISDVISALSERRPYFRNGNPKPMDIIRNALRTEAPHYGIPSEFVERVIDALLNGNEERSPQARIFEKCAQVISV